MRVVLDANVLTSGAVALPGRPLALVIERWIGRRYLLFVSAWLRMEVERTLAKPYFAARLAPGDRVRFLALIDQRAGIVVPTVPVEGVATHPEDDRVLETALAARAEYLVTGDRGLQQLRAFAGIPIIDPAAFLAVLDRAVV